MLFMASEHGAHSVFLQALGVATALAVPLDQYIRDAILDSAARRGDAQQFEAQKAFMLQQGCKLTQSSHASHVRLLAATAPPADVYEYVFVTCKSQPKLASSHMLTLAFAVAARDTQCTFELLQRLWRAGRAAKVAPANMTISSLAVAARGLALEPWQMERCFGVAMEFCAWHKHAIADTLANVLFTCAEHGFAVRVVDVWQLAQQHGVRMNARLATGMLVCCKEAVRDSARIAGVASDVSSWLFRTWRDLSSAAPPAGAVAADFCIAFNALLSYQAIGDDMQPADATYRVRSNNLQHHVMRNDLSCKLFMLLPGVGNAAAPRSHCAVDAIQLLSLTCRLLMQNITRSQAT